MPSALSDCRLMPSATHISVAIPMMDELDNLDGLLSSLRRQSYKNFTTYICVNQPEAWNVSDDEYRRMVVKNNAETITRLEKDYAGLTKECETIKADISTLLAGYCDDWLTDTETVRKKLKDDAKTFSDKRKRLNDSLVEQEKTQALIATLTQYIQDILRSCPDWTTNAVPQAYTCHNINTEWTNLMSKVTSLVSKLQDCKTVITSSGEALAAYYLETGKTEQSLAELATQESKVAAARKLVTDTDAQLKSRSDAIAEAQQQIEAALRELGITERAELPDKQEIEEHKASVGHLRDETLAKKTQAETQLELHQKNIKHLKEIE